MKANQINADTERKIALKADLRELERAVPQRLEDLLRGLNSQIADIKMEVARTATKEEFQVLAMNKVSLVGVITCRCKIELNNTLDYQKKSLPSFNHVTNPAQSFPHIAY